MLHNRFSIRYSTVLFFLFFSANVLGQKAYTVGEIPDPKKNGGGWVSDPDHILSAINIEEVNTTVSNFEQKTNVQVAVVIVKDFDHNQEDFDFAYQLFNTWGIGQKTSNNGLLLFISKDRRKYRFITGTGTEGVLPDVTLKHIAERNLLPAFRQNNFGTGIVNAINAIGAIILNPENKSELNQLFTQQESESSSFEKIWLPVAAIILAFSGIFKLLSRQAKKLPKANPKIKTEYNKGIINGCVGIFFSLFICIFIFIFTGATGLLQKLEITSIPYILFLVLSIGLLFRYLFYVSDLRRIYNDDENYNKAVKNFQRKNFWLMIFSPLIIIPFLRNLLTRNKQIARFKPILDSKNEEMIRIDRDVNIEGKPFLTEGQRKEEILKAYDYDIWQSVDHKEHIIKAWPAEEYNDYTECPACGFRAYQLNKQVTTKTATYTREGQAKIINECGFCKKNEFIKSITLAMLVKSSSSGSSSSGSSSSSSSSSSWGGGSSSGGGSGGSW